MVYGVEIDESRRRILHVKAATAEQAIKYIESLYFDGRIELNEGDNDGTDIDAFILRNDGKEVVDYDYDAEEQYN